MGAGTIGDVFDAHQRGRAFSYYLTGPMLGPAVGKVYMIETHYIHSVLFLESLTAYMTLTLIIQLYKTIYRPIFGGYLNIGLGWQSIFWLLAILCVFVWFGILFLLPETRYTAPVVPGSSFSATVTTQSKDTVNEENEQHHDEKDDSDVSSTANEQEKQNVTCNDKRRRKVSKEQDKEKKPRQCRFINPVAALSLLRNKNIALTVLFLGTL